MGSTWLGLLDVSGEIDGDIVAAAVQLPRMPRHAL